MQEKNNEAVVIQQIYGICNIKFSLDYFTILEKTFNGINRKH